MTDAIDLTTEQRKTLITLLRRFLPGVAVWAYGSRVKWTARPNSDLDLVAFTTPAQRSQVPELKDALAESNLPFPVDLHVWDEVPERFREIIRNEYVVVQEARQPESGSGGLGMAGESPIEYDLRWPVVALSEIAGKIGSGATPKGGADAYLPSRARFALVRSQNVFDRPFDYNGLAFISDEQADGLRGVILQPNDILLNITGDGITFGRACMVPKDVLPACVNQHVSIIRLDPQRADAGYVLAFLTHPKVKSYIESFNAGGSRRAITKGHIESFRLPLPPLPEQRAIAHILGTLDNKIELNRRMNETLEVMARALFKSWFVDFDPVRAKAEGREPGLPKPLADLFPESFEDSELGEIPRGWAIGEIQDCCTHIQNGGTPQRNESRYWDGGNIPWLTSGEVRQPIVIATGGFITELGLTESSAKWVPAYSTVIALYGATAGQVSLVSSPLTTNQAVCALVPKKDFAFFNYLSMRAATSDLESKAVGSAQQNISKGIVQETQVILPPTPVVERFAMLVGPLFDQWIASLCQSRTLAALRDTLLPKLISGEVRVKDAERLVEKAM